MTVEDCLHDMENLFQLVLVASRRARQIYLGSEPRVPEDGDKPTVIALREIAESKVGVEVLDEKMTDVGEQFEDMEASPDTPDTAADADPAADAEPSVDTGPSVDTEPSADAEPSDSPQLPPKPEV